MKSIAHLLLQLTSFQIRSSKISKFHVKCVLMLVDLSNGFRMNTLAGSLTVCDISTIIFNGVNAVIHYAEDIFFLPVRQTTMKLFIVFFHISRLHIRTWA